MAHRNTTKHLAYTMSFNLSEVPEWVRKYKNGELKTWKKRIKTNSCGQIFLCNIYCNTIAIHILRHMLKSVNTLTQKRHNTVC